MHLLTSLLILIVLARLLGRLFVKYNQPAIVGEMLTGVILGPTVLNFMHGNVALSSIAELAIFLVVLSAGLEMNFKEVINAMRGKGLIIALAGFLIPLLSGILVGTMFGLDAMRTVFLGLCVSITALPVAVRMLESFNILKTDIAKYSVATAIINDVAALLILGVILDLPQEKSFLIIAKSIGISGGKLLLLAAFILGMYRLFEYAQKSGINIKKIPEKLVDFFGNEALFGIVILFVLVFGSVSETLGFHFVIGAFFGALLIDREFFFASRYSELERTIGSITSGFLGPVFFAYIGLEFNIAEVRSVEFLLAVILVSILSKILAGWLGGRLIGLSSKTALSIGIILNGRGIMELVIASIAFQKGFIGQGLFSTLVLMGVVTTMITPILFKKFGDLPGRSA
ncbi:MAG: sodium:proton antiporter [Bdellovibrionales bacterium RBG_16_40_8]|nr:MAG: sodium:proton antiporter [Bdellovibrionales bacterium RBG_16_40_8]